MSESLLKPYLDPFQEVARPFHIDFELKGRNHVAMTYGHLLWANFNPSVGIILHFSTHTVTIKGRNLQPLYDGILLHEVPKVKVTPERFDRGGNDEMSVAEIHIIQKPGPTETLGVETPEPGHG